MDSREKQPEGRRSEETPRQPEEEQAKPKPLETFDPGGGAISQTPSRFRREETSAKFWLLPLGNDDAWAISEIEDPKELARKLEHVDQSPPIVYSVDVKPEEKPHALGYARECAKSKFRERLHATLFSFATRMLIGMGWVLAALVGLKIPGAIKIIDQLLLVGGIGFLGYTVVRYGLPLLSWFSHSSATGVIFKEARWQHSPFMDRLDSALKLRRTLKPEERGQSPDAELLDTNAYKKLIQEGVTTAAELSAIGKAVDIAMKLHPADTRKLSEIAKEAGLDSESAIFYRDLSAAATEIRIEQNLL